MFGREILHRSVPATGDMVHHRCCQHRSRENNYPVGKIGIGYGNHTGRSGKDDNKGCGYGLTQFNTDNAFTHHIQDVPPCPELIADYGSKADDERQCTEQSGKFSIADFQNITNGIFTKRTDFFGEKINDDYTHPGPGR